MRPRIYGIVATRAPVVAVFRRGPSRWCHVGRWNLETGRYDPGAWTRARLFPRRADVSPDGRFLTYFAHHPGAGWTHGDAYVAVSRLPWLTALHAFAVGGTWTRGYHFVGQSPDAPVPPPPCGLPLDLALSPTPVVQFATERRRGWIEAPDSPPRRSSDAWDEQRCARLYKPQPGGAWVLGVERRETGGEGHAIDGICAAYWLEGDGDIRPLDDVQWADWDHEGRLVLATRQGRLQLRSAEGGGRVLLVEHDLSALDPAPAPSPAWAQRW